MQPCVFVPVTRIVAHSRMKGLLFLKTRAILGGCIGVVFAALAWSGALDALEDLTVDYRLRLAGIVDPSALAGHTSCHEAL